MMRSKNARCPLGAVNACSGLAAGHVLVSATVLCAPVDNDPSASLCESTTAEMLIDANELPHSSRIDCDICIAGSGPVGVTLAVELAATRMRVCLVEGGGLSSRAAVAASPIAEQLGLLIDPVKFQRHVFGGGSNRWGGLSGRWFRAKPLDPIDFEARSWIANSSWPFGYDVLRPFFERAGRILQVPSLRDLNLQGRARLDGSRVP